jgi:type IV secretion system protein VirB10
MSVDLKEPGPARVEKDPRPVVALPRSAVPGELIAVITLIAAILLFLALGAQFRQASTQEQELSSAGPVPPPPPLFVTADPVAQTTVVRPARPVMVPRVPAPEPRRAPTAVPTPVAPAPPPTPPPEPYYRPLPPPAPGSLTPQRTSQSAPALVVDTASSGITVGTMIPAVLETPVDTSRPGLARARVTEDVRAQGSRRVLIPRGSRLIGEYQSDVRSGQNRVLVNWTQLIRPDGLTVRLASPAADSLGGAGIPGRVNSFFLSRFFNAALQTALTLGGNLVSERGGNTVIVGLPGGGSNVTTGQDVISGGSNRRKITVKHGTTFHVFVARELDFSGSAAPATNAVTSTPSPTIAPLVQQ